MLIHITWFLLVFLCPFSIHFCYQFLCFIRYDIVDLTRQALAKYANQLFLEVIEAYNLKDKYRVTYQSTRFLELVKDMDTLLACHHGFLLGPWLESAKQLAQNADQEKQVWSSSNYQSPYSKLTMVLLLIKLNYLFVSQCTVWMECKNSNNNVVRQHRGGSKPATWLRWDNQQTISSSYRITFAGPNFANVIEPICDPVILFWFRKQILERTSTRLLWSTSSNLFQILDRISRKWAWFPFERLEEGVDKVNKWLAEQQKLVSSEKHRRCTEHIKVALQ